MHCDLRPDNMLSGRLQPTAHTPVMGTHSSYEHGCVSRTIVTLLEVSESEEGVVAVHLPIGPLEPCSGCINEGRK